MAKLKSTKWLMKQFIAVCNARGYGYMEHPLARLLETVLNNRWWDIRNT
jgi:hypothetical protein